jgi:hypothetical protein
MPGRVAGCGVCERGRAGQRADARGGGPTFGDASRHAIERVGACVWRHFGAGAQSWVGRVLCCGGVARCGSFRSGAGWGC